MTDRQVVVGVDGALSAVRALDRAAEEAVMRDAALTTVYAVADVDIAGPVLTSSPSRVRKRHPVLAFTTPALVDSPVRALARHARRREPVPDNGVCDGPPCTCHSDTLRGGTGVEQRHSGPGRPPGQALVDSARRDSVTGLDHERGAGGECCAVRATRSFPRDQRPLLPYDGYDKTDHASLRHHDRRSGRSGRKPRRSRVGSPRSTAHLRIAPRRPLLVVASPHRTGTSSTRDGHEGRCRPDPSDGTDRPKRRARCRGRLRTSGAS